MRNKFFLFIIAAFMATSSAWAGPYDPVDKIPGTVYMQNIVFNGGSITFDDTFHPEKTLNRHYNVYAYAKTPETAIYDVTGGYDYGYIYESNNNGLINFHSTALSHGNCSRDYFNSNGGQVTINVTALMDAAREQEVEQVHFVIAGRYQDNLGNWSSYEDSYAFGAYLKNYVDVTLASVTCSFGTNSYGVEEDDTQLSIKVKVHAYGSTNYSIQRNSKQGADDWATLKTGNISTIDAKAGTVQNVSISLNENMSKNFDLRLIAKTVKTGISDTAYSEVGCKYKYTGPNGTTEYLYPGTKRFVNMPADCRAYNYICSKPVQVTKHSGGEAYVIVMPEANLTVEEIAPTYTVKFLNADYTLLKTVEVECGADATSEAPANPTYSTYTFIGWSQDLTNVHKNMSVLAKYDIGNTYWFDAYLSNHENAVYPATGFEYSVTRAMVGDKLTFAADVFAATNATIAYETAFWDNNAQDYLWQKNGHITVADYTTPNKEQFFDQTINVCYTPNNSYINPFQRKMAVRFIMFIAGQTIYSDPWEIDIYYPLFINAPEMDALFVENTAGDFSMGEQNIFIPALYNDTVRLYSINGANGGCFSFGRVLYPARDLGKGVDEEGNAFIIGPGELETVNTSVSKKLVVFDGVYGNGYPKQLDFTAEGFGKHNGYYGEVVPCGGSVTMPEDPTQENAIFIGWQAWNDGYADDAYLHVPAVDDNIIGFTAQFEYLPEVPQYKVRFYGKDGTPLLLDTLINEGENAMPPVVPEVSGYHFVGWDKPYTTITANVDITALYGEDTKVWTVTYKNWDGSDLGSEQVNDGETAQGVNATREGYTFVKWSDYTTGDDVDMDHITANITVQAVFTETLHTVSYRVEGEVTYTIQVVHGFAASSIYYPHGTPTKASTEAKVYTFTGWTPEVATITEDVTFDAVFEESARTYTVIFQNWDHTLLSEQQVEYGKAAQAPADPTREGYTFKGWDREFNNILADMTVTAVFEKQSGATGIENTPAPLWGESERGCKFLRDGNLYIIRPDGKIINAIGVRVK